MDGPPAVNTTQDNATAYVEHLRNTVSSVTALGSFTKAIRVATLIAPDRDFVWTRPIARRLAFEAHPKEKRSRVVDSARLYNLGVDLMQQAQSYAGKALIRNASTYRNGLMIALLALCPLRLKNFTALRLGHNLVDADGGWTISITHNDSKTRRPIEMQLPDNVTGYLQTYLDLHRCRYPGWKNTDALWLSTYGGALTPGALYVIISQRTREAFGHTVNPHLFRDCAATSVATRFGSKMGVAVALLAHSSQHTIDKHYNQANMITAVQDYQKHLDALHAS
jgi:integrase/recombinase XerD